MCLSHLIYTVRPCLIHACHAMLRPCRSSQGHTTARPCCAVALRRTAWSEHGMASVNQTRPHCVNQMGQTHSKPLATRHGMGTACARHGNGMLCVNRPLLTVSNVQCLLHSDSLNPSGTHARKASQSCLLLYYGFSVVKREFPVTFAPPCTIYK